MRWSIKNASAMAYLVARWAVDPKRAVEQGLAAWSLMQQQCHEVQ